uniref:Uncharacterized protein n=1 Tax=Panagrolaimus superbus TaxID=310955 RepID=A0A914YEA7_9BILA
MNTKVLSVFLCIILFSTLTFAVEVLKKSEELPCQDLGCTISPTAVSPKSDDVIVKRRASGYVGDASYPITEPPHDSVTPMGVEKESWLPKILGLGTR